MQEAKEGQEGHGSGKRMNEESMSKTLDEIDHISEVLNVSTDSLRRYVNSICSSFYETFKDPLAAKQVYDQMRDEGWAILILKDNTVRAEGRVFHSLKNAGLEFQSERPIYETVENGHITTYTIGFGREEKGVLSPYSWCFYVKRTPGNAIPLRNLSRDLLPYFVDSLPAFLAEFKDYLTEQTENTLASSMKAKQLTQKR